MKLLQSSSSFYSFFLLVYAMKSPSPLITPVGPLFSPFRSLLSFQVFHNTSSLLYSVRLKIFLLLFQTLTRKKKNEGKFTWDWQDGRSTSREMRMSSMFLSCCLSHPIWRDISCYVRIIFWKQYISFVLSHDDDDDSTVESVTHFKNLEKEGRERFWHRQNFSQNMKV